MKSLLTTLLVSITVMGCHSYHAEYSSITTSYKSYSVYPAGAKKDDIPLLQNSGAQRIGSVAVFGYPNSNNTNDPIDAAIEEASNHRATHIVFIDEKVVDEELNCVSNPAYGRIYTRCSANSEMGYYYDLYVVPKENWNMLPTKLKPKVR